MDISTDRTRLDLDLIHDFLSTESYWAKGRPRAVTERAVAGSLCFGAYEDGAQIAFARLVTDGATVGYLGDVFVVGAAQGRGVGTALVRAIVEHPDVVDLRRLILVTADAHGLYEGAGFTALRDASQWMERFRGLPSEV